MARKATSREEANKRGGEKAVARGASSKTAADISKIKR